MNFLPQITVAAKIGLAIAALALLAALGWLALRGITRARTWYGRRPSRPRQVRPMSLQRQHAKRRLRRWGFAVALLLTGPRLFHQAYVSKAYAFLGWRPAIVAACILFALLVESMWFSGILGWDDEQRWRSIASFAAYAAATAIIQLFGAPREVFWALPVGAAVWNGLALDLRDEAPTVSQEAPDAEPAHPAPAAAGAVARAEDADRPRHPRPDPGAPTPRHPARAGVAELGEPASPVDDPAPDERPGRPDTRRPARVELTQAARDVVAQEGRRPSRQVLGRLIRAAHPDWDVTQHLERVAWETVGDLPAPERATADANGRAE